MSRYPGRFERALDESLDYERKLKDKIEVLNKQVLWLAKELAFYRHKVTKDIVSVPELIEKAKEK